nr:hypothetical protein [Polyangiaceae bacterium]
ELSQRILRKIEKSKLTAEENATVKEEATWEQAKREAATEAKAVGLREGREAGEREGKAAGLRAAVLDLCEVLGLELTEARKAELAGLDVAGLEALRQHLKQHRSWPT